MPKAYTIATTVPCTIWAKNEGGCVILKQMEYHHSHFESERVFTLFSLEAIPYI